MSGRVTRSKAAPTSTEACKPPLKKVENKKSIAKPKTVKGTKVRIEKKTENADNPTIEQMLAKMKKCFVVLERIDVDEYVMRQAEAVRSVSETSLKKKKGSQDHSSQDQTYSPRSQVSQVTYAAAAKLEIPDAAESSVICISDDSDVEVVNAIDGNKTIHAKPEKSLPADNSANQAIVVLVNVVTNVANAHPSVRTTVLSLSRTETVSVEGGQFIGSTVIDGADDTANVGSTSLSDSNLVVDSVCSTHTLESNMEDRTNRSIEGTSNTSNAVNEETFGVGESRHVSQQVEPSVQSSYTKPDQDVVQNTGEVTGDEQSAHTVQQSLFDAPVVEAPCIESNPVEAATETAHEMACGFLDENEHKTNDGNVAENDSEGKAGVTGNGKEGLAHGNDVSIGLTSTDTDESEKELFLANDDIFLDSVDRDFDKLVADLSLSDEHEFDILVHKKIKIKKTPESGNKAANVIKSVNDLNLGENHNSSSGSVPVIDKVNDSSNDSGFTEVNRSSEEIETINSIPVIDEATPVLKSDSTHAANAIKSTEKIKTTEQDGESARAMNAAECSLSCNKSANVSVQIGASIEPASNEMIRSPTVVVLPSSKNESGPVGAHRSLKEISSLSNEIIDRSIRVSTSMPSPMRRFLMKPKKKSHSESILQSDAKLTTALDTAHHVVAPIEVAVSASKTVDRSTASIESDEKNVEENNAESPGTKIPVKDDAEVSIECGSVGEIQQSLIESTSATSITTLEAALSNKSDESNESDESDESDDEDLYYSLNDSYPKMAYLIASLKALEESVTSESSAPTPKRKRDKWIDVKEETNPKHVKIVETSNGEFEEAPQSPPKVEFGFVVTPLTPSTPDYEVKLLKNQWPKSKKRSRAIAFDENSTPLTQRPEHLFDNFEQIPNEKRKRIATDFNPVQVIPKASELGKRRKQPSATLIPAELFAFRRRNLYQKGVLRYMPPHTSKRYK